MSSRAPFVFPTFVPWKYEVNLFDQDTYVPLDKVKNGCTAHSEVLEQIPDHQTTVIDLHLQISIEFKAQIPNVSPYSAASVHEPHITTQYVQIYGYDT